jgi:hypothetical protein
VNEHVWWRDATRGQGARGTHAAATWWMQSNPAHDCRHINEYMAHEKVDVAASITYI